MRSPVRLVLPPRQVSLFLISVLLPSAVLLALGVLSMVQERELARRTAADNRGRVVEQTRQSLLATLEQVKLQQITHALAPHGRAGTPPVAPVVFVAALDDDHLILPWEDAIGARRLQESLNRGAFAKAIGEAETLEANGRAREAVARYRVAIGAATEPAQHTYGRLLRARALGAAARSGERQEELRRVLASPPDLVDQGNVPLGLYAAAALAPDGAPLEQLLAWVEVVATGGTALSREALGIARTLASTLAASDSVDRLNDVIRERERAESLRQDLTRLARAPSAEPVWVAYGDPVWLASVTPPVGPLDGLVIVVRAQAALQQISTPAREIRLAVAGEPGHAFGETFPGLRLVIGLAEDRGAASSQQFLAVGVLLAVTFTIGAGALLWRDVQRDLRLSALRSQFVSSVSHELRTPLTAIRMFAETLKLDGDDDRASRSDYLDTILHESERLSRLVDNVLDFGRIERGQKSYRFEPLDLHEVVSKAARAAQYPIERAGFTLHLALEPGLPPIAADSDALQQAILNLLSNAMKYSGDSRVIELRLDRVGQHARIQVVDHGIGIAPHDRRRIFERFYRAVSAETRNIPGTGLGLTIVAHIASAHGGRVDVDSDPGRRTVFTLSVPVISGNGVAWAALPA